MLQQAALYSSRVSHKNSRQSHLAVRLCVFPTKLDAMLKLEFITFKRSLFRGGIRLQQGVSKMCLTQMLPGTLQHGHLFLAPWCWAAAHTSGTP